MQSNYKIAVQPKPAPSPACVVIGVDPSIKRIVDVLNLSVDTELIFSDCTDQILEALHQFRSLKVIVLNLSAQYFPSYLLEVLQLQFMDTPVVAIVPDHFHSPELALNCTECGISKVFSQSELLLLDQHVIALGKSTQYFQYLD